MQNYIHVPKNEKVLWKGRPNRKASVLETIFNSFLVFVVIWCAVDGTIILLSHDKAVMGFIAVHLFPVYLYLFGCLTAGLRAKNTRYVLTDRAVYFQTGIFTIKTEREPLNEITHTGIHRGILDMMLGLGDVYILYVHDSHHIDNIKHYEKLCEMLSEISTDTYTDTMYPNDMRPQTNHGYRTEYTRFSGEDYGINKDDIQ